MAALSGLSIISTKVFAKAADPSKPHRMTVSRLNRPLKSATFTRGRMCAVGPVAAAPDQLSEKVEESVKKAQETCADDPVSGECAAAWDEVEELSAAASHARDKLKESSDPLETYCKDNPETDECRTYDN